uniref:GTPase Der n=1 Tax=Timspurckia oligopyrenoides TaxID=708627 RepID=A0A7S0ZLH7_9RHOD|mmetsp:Transcript_991/g.1879  ORF Transcript_991/g.1879 Transcript_991/m.1879 type:complete len:594 (+) Transcript_991:63-1844(+)
MDSITNSVTFCVSGFSSLLSSTNISHTNSHFVNTKSSVYGGKNSSYFNSRFFQSIRSVGLLKSFDFKLSAIKTISDISQSDEDLDFDSNELSDDELWEKLGLNSDGEELSRKEENDVISKSESKRRKRRARLPVVAIIGRPNVGKSQLVNRISGDFKAGAIVEDVVGITRDRTYRNAFWTHYEFQVVDTGGLIFDDDPEQLFIKHIRAQALMALEEASAAILVVDGQAGVNPIDEQIASFLRKEAGKKPVVVAVNKCESDMGPIMAAEFWKLGLGEPYAISALHGTGTGDLLDEVVQYLPQTTIEDVQKQNEELNEVGESWLDEVSVAIVGRPNVGKSSLLNKFVGKERAIVSDIAGTTRDTVDERIQRNGVEYRLLDTAGVRRKTRISYGTEFFMINRAFKSIRRSDVVLLVIDIMDGVTEQDRKLAERIVAEGRACVVVVNKWDLIPDKDNQSHEKARLSIAEALPMLKWAPIVLVSAITGQRVHSLLDSIDNVVAQHRRRVSTAVLNEALDEMLTWHKPPSTATAKQGKVYYCTQVASSPPTVAMFVNESKLFSQNYRRYAEGRFRSSLGFEGTPLRILWRSKSKVPSTL